MAARSQLSDILNRFVPLLGHRAGCRRHQVHRKPGLHQSPPALDPNYGDPDAMADKDPYALVLRGLAPAISR